MPLPERKMKHLVVPEDAFAKLERYSHCFKRTLVAQFEVWAESLENQVLDRLNDEERERYFRGAQLWEETEHMKRVMWGPFGPRHWWDFGDDDDDDDGGGAQNKHLVGVA